MKDFVSTDHVVEFLKTRYGIDYSRGYLNRLRSCGGGPVFHRIGGRIYYKPSDLADWIQSRSSGPMRSTSQAIAILD
jgi:hypothetical protein